MNNYPHMFNPNFGNVNLQFQEEITNINNQIRILNQDLKRIERRLFNLEKNFLPNSYSAKLVPTQLNNNNFDYMNSNYPKDNYII